MKDSPSVYEGGGGRGAGSSFDAVLFSNWRNDYTTTVDELLDQRFTAAAIQAELERVRDVAGSYFASDPYVGGSMVEPVEALDQYWTARLAAVRLEVP